MLEQLNHNGVIVPEPPRRVGLVLKADLRPGHEGQLQAKVDRVDALLGQDEPPHGG